MVSGNSWGYFFILYTTYCFKIRGDWTYVDRNSLKNKQTHEPNMWNCTQIPMHFLWGKVVLYFIFLNKWSWDLSLLPDAMPWKSSSDPRYLWPSGENAPVFNYWCPFCAKPSLLLFGSKFILTWEVSPILFTVTWEKHWWTYLWFNMLKVAKNIQTSSLEQSRGASNPASCITQCKPHTFGKSHDRAWKYWLSLNIQHSCCALSLVSFWQN